jgi:subtilase family serine protease
VFHPSRLCRTRSTQAYGCYVKLDAHTLAIGRAAPDPGGWGAPALRDAYDVPNTSSHATVAVVLWYDYPTAEKDMNHYRKQFGLPLCTSASGCFTKINQKGQQSHYPPADYDADVEMALDLQMISTACPTCHIVLAEANEPTDRSLDKAEAAAIAAGATVTNHSYGGIEYTGVGKVAPHYDVPGVTAVAASGDEGYGPASFPASAPGVVSVGGTTLARSATAARGWTEKAWQWGGSGCSAYFGKPVWQLDTACPGRTDADLSAIAQGLAIYDTSLPKHYRGWLEVDGTSASSPFVAGLIGNADAGGLKPADLYGHPARFNDVVAGSNGFCRGSYLCTGVAGYDAPTGWGSPKGIAPFQ